MEFQKLFLAVAQLGLFDRVMQASLVRVLTSYGLCIEHSPLAEESWNTPVIISHCLTSCTSLSSPFSSLCCVDSHFFNLSVLLVLSLEQEWLHEPTCNVECWTTHKYVTTSVGLAVLAPINVFALQLIALFWLGLQLKVCVCIVQLEN